MQSFNYKLDYIMNMLRILFKLKNTLCLFYFMFCTICFLLLFFARIINLEELYLDIALENCLQNHI